PRSLVQVNESAPVLRCDRFERSLQRPIAFTPGGSKNVAQQAVRMHADQHRFCRIADIAANERDMRITTVHLTLVSDQAEFSVLGLDHRLTQAMNVAL